MFIFLSSNSTTFSSSLGWIPSARRGCRSLLSLNIVAKRAPERKTFCVGRFYCIYRTSTDYSLVSSYGSGAVWPLCRPFKGSRHCSSSHSSSQTSLAPAVCGEASAHAVVCSPRFHPRLDRARLPLDRGCGGIVGFSERRVQMLRRKQWDLWLTTVEASDDTQEQIRAALERAAQRPHLGLVRCPLGQAPPSYPRTLLR